MTFLGLTIGAPLILAGLLALPLIWFLLRLTPPRPRDEVFPPTAILSEIAPKEETPAQSPWWLTLLRLAMAALVILALSEPVWNARDKQLAAEGPVLIVLDNGWTAGANWPARKAAARVLLDEAEDAGQPVAFALTVTGTPEALSPKLASEIRPQLEAAQARSIPGDLSPITAALSQGTTAFGTIAWLADGLQSELTTGWITAVTAHGPTRTLYLAPESGKLQVLTKVTNTPEALTVGVERADFSGEKTGTATAFDQKGRPLGTASYEFEGNTQFSEASFDLPVELRNEVARIAIDGGATAGSVQLLDERFRRRRVGIISGAKADAADQPLLAPTYYIDRALAPFSEVRQPRAAGVADAVPELLEQDVSTLVLADIGTLPTDTEEQLTDWVRRGGLLVRFAGPRMAGAESDALVPVELRRGDRSLGGTLTWGTPQPLANFAEDSPFSGLDIPADVTVSRQVLAEPGIDLVDRTWASLADGTPLITASQRGEGWIVLFHVTANTSWSNLPLSGSFVDLLRRIVAVSNGAISADTVAGGGTTAAARSATETTLPPLLSIDPQGRILPASSDVEPLPVRAGAEPELRFQNPPGTYGTSDAFRALNLFSGPADLKLFDPATLPAGAVVEGYASENATDIKPWLLALAIILLTLDCLAVLWMGGALRRMPKTRSMGAAALVLVFFVSNPTPGLAQEDSFDFENTLRTRLAYVQTGDDALDRLSQKGLLGLTQFISSRTSLEPGEPVGVNIETDELAFFPLLYWPISEDAAVPNEATMARIDTFMKRGGSVLFDTRDQLSGGFGNGAVTPQTQKLRQILSTLDIPPLEPVPENHVLTRAFYLLNVFPGRYLDGPLWVETQATGEDDAERPARAGDGVSSVMITSNDLAGAWAIEADRSPSLPIVPPNPTQRVYAYRTGANIVMYTLTGNYKSDQVHIPALLERLGQ
ncbi:DUF4159 domain-containing protein [Ahrensia sp. R2A130]|uniref:DUF4159 domain-containing protein n=1 Tax=Ahrensia sp. R2A130 TaxID=744979 RepID=UPI0001E0F8AB|nr:DUF4159 domain-containing protein [Ahrensia sp. R2A130]EFL89048.1 transmembrane protein [Ahrensia sp. R2A130]